MFENEIIFCLKIKKFEFDYPKSLLKRTKFVGKNLKFKIQNFLTLKFIINEI
ncbi:MAG: hypothetical protein STSR0008_02030 [Ignavibacterium sp.]